MEDMVKRGLIKHKFYFLKNKSLLKILFLIQAF